MSGADWSKVEWFLEDWRRQSGVAFWFTDEQNRVLAQSSFPHLCEYFCDRHGNNCHPTCPYGLQQLSFPSCEATSGSTLFHMGGYFDTEAQARGCLLQRREVGSAEWQAAWEEAVQQVPVLSSAARNALAAAANSFARLPLDCRTQWQSPYEPHLQRDMLTGLYNRAVWEERLLEIEQRQQLPVAVIVADIDGLKFVNETLGVEVGNRILERAAMLLRNAFLGQGLLARIGGDSFGVVCTGLTLPEAEEILAQLRNAVAKPHDNSMSVGMSFGLAFGGSLPLSIKELRYEAERSAMSEKQFAKRASRHHVVRQVVERLRTFELVGEEQPDEQHLLAITVGRALHLPEESLHKLSLLLQYHAIGKAVFDNALVYHAATQGEREEQQEQQQHASVGYRLALTLPDAAPVAELILKQHEYWDGSGCPFGLAGGEIPVECRVLAVVKEYQRLRRQWGRCLTLPAEALSALHRMSGRQLDPHIVEVLLSILSGAQKRPQPGGV